MSMPPVPPTPAPAAKKGLPVLAWVALGCGAIVLLGALAVGAVGWWGAQKLKQVAADFEADPATAAARLAVKVNPDLEIVESTAEDGRITVRQKSTGKVASFDLDEIQQGRLVFETDEGRMEIAADDTGGSMVVTTAAGTARYGAGAGAEPLPEWVPLHARASEQSATYSATGPQGSSGAVRMLVPASVDQVIADYREILTARGYEIRADSLTRTPEGAVAALDATRPDGRSLTIAIAPAGDAAQVVLHYSGD